MTVNFFLRSTSVNCHLSTSYWPAANGQRPSVIELLWPQVRFSIFLKRLDNCEALLPVDYCQLRIAHCRNQFFPVCRIYFYIWKLRFFFANHANCLHMLNES